MNSLTKYLFVIIQLKYVYLIELNQFYGTIANTTHLNTNTKIINDVFIDVNKKLLQSFDTLQLYNMLRQIKNLLKNNSINRNGSLNELKSKDSITNTNLKLKLKKDVKVFYKANTVLMNTKLNKTINNVFPLIAIDESNTQNENYLTIKINKELLIVIASVVLITIIVIIILNNLSKCIRSDSSNVYFRHYN